MASKIAVITGPTATGKTALGVLLARKLGGEVVSADSMQVYQGMDIGTAKPTEKETTGIPHHMLGVASPFEDYSAARYVGEASACVDDILSRGMLPIVVGGTGLYIDALIRGETFSVCGDDALRRVLGERYDRLGGEKLLEELREVDTAAAERLHPNDKRRIIRALEIYQMTGETITSHDEASKNAPPRYEAVKIALSYADRADLYENINRRVDAMFEKGLVGEVRHLLDMGVTPSMTAMQAIGYKELAGALTTGGSLEEAAAVIKMESRRYAKRQLSWLRRDERVKWILWDKIPDFDAALQISTKYLEEYGYYKAVWEQN